MSSDVKRYVSTRLLPDASTWNVSGAAHTYVHISDYAALEAENARLQEDVKKWMGLAQSVQTIERITESGEARRAQIAAIQQAKGEEVEVVAIAEGEGELPESSWRGLKWGDRIDPMDVPAGSDLMTVAQHQRITAAMAAEVERLKRENANIRVKWTEYGRELEAERDALRAECERLADALDRHSVITGDYIARCQRLADELAEVKGQEAVATIDQGEPYEDGTPNPCKILRWTGNNAEDDFPAGTKLYALPPASPDVEGLVKALEEIERRNDNPARFDAEIDHIVTAALSTWRQGQDNP